MLAGNPGLTRRWEAGELVRGRKEEAMGRGGWASGDGVGVGAGGLETLWPQPLHFSRFRFVNSSGLWLRAGGMGPVPLWPVSSEAWA